MKSSNRKAHVVTNVAGSLVGHVITPELERETEARLSFITGSRVRVHGCGDGSLTIDVVRGDEWVGVEISGSSIDALSI